MNTITTTVRNSIRIIRINKPKKKNALSVREIDEIRKIIADDGNSSSTSVSVLTGTSSYFSSGLDLNEVSQCILEKEDDSYVNNIPTSVEKMIEQIINYPKLFISLVNGPAVGIGTTILALCDYVYASERATFQAPFVKLGLNVEACSSAMFPLIMGRTRTTELIFMGKKIDVQEAKDVGLVGQIFKDTDIDNVYENIENIAKLPRDIMQINKKLIIGSIRDKLLESNKQECEMLKVTLKSNQFINSVKAFQFRKK